MEKDKSKSGNRGLVILLCVLLVIIVGLGVGIGVVNMGGTDSNDRDEEKVVLQTNLPTEIDTMSEEGRKFLEQGTAESFDLAMQYFDEKSENAIDNDVYFDVESVRINLLIVYGYFSEAITYLDNVRKDKFNDSQLYTIYDYYSFAYNALNNKPMASTYQEKMDVIRANSRSGV